MITIRTSHVAVAALGLGLLAGPALAQPAAGPAAPPRHSQPPAALEIPRPAAAAKFLGDAVRGSNYTVRPTARSDGIMRIFEVETPYGQFQFDGVEFTRMRLREIDGDRRDRKDVAFARHGPSRSAGRRSRREARRRFHRQSRRCHRPLDERHPNMFDRVGARMAGQRTNRDSLADSPARCQRRAAATGVRTRRRPLHGFPAARAKAARDGAARWLAAN